MVVKYFVNDKEFDNEDDAIKYEKKLEAKKREQQKLEEEKSKRRKEVDDAYEKFVELEKKYVEDYGRYEFGDLFKLLFP